MEIFNVGDLDLIVDQVLALPNPGPFTIQPLPSTPVTLKPGAEVDFTITFTPTAAGATQTGTIRITSNDPVTPTFDINVTATAGTGSLVTAIADHGDFGKVCVGSFRDEPLTLANDGTCDVSVTDITSSSPDFLPPAVGNYPLTVAPGAAINLPIRFQPTGTGPAIANITIDSDDLTGPKQVRVSGTAPAPRLAVVMADSGNFGDVCVGRFSDEPLTLCSAGHCPLTVTALSSSSTEFLVPTVQSYPLVIENGDSLTMPLRFQPTSTGPKSAIVTINTDDPAGPHVVDVSGRAPSGKLAVTGSTFFGGVKACCREERTISICNVGDCKLNVASVAFKRKNRHWKLINNPFPATLHPGSCLGVVIRYKATEKCPRCSELVITSDDPITPVKTLEVVAYTIWSDCCRKCCEDCRKGTCEKRHCDPCCCGKCYDDRNDEEDEDVDAAVD